MPASPYEPAAAPPPPAPPPPPGPPLPPPGPRPAGPPAGDGATTVGPTAVQRARRWAEAEHWARTLDSSIRIPGTRARVGWDAVIGLIPGVGDAVGLGLSVLVITRGALLGAQRWTVSRMVLVALLDAAVGTVPIAGGLFDFVFKANERNLRTVARHGVDPAGVEAESRRIVVMTLVLLATVGTLAVAGLVALAIWLVRLL